MKLIDAVKERILVLDGAMGTMIQSYGLDESDFRGDEFSGWVIPLKGCNDILALTRRQRNLSQNRILSLLPGVCHRICVTTGRSR